MDDGVPRIAGGEEHLQAGPAARRLVGELAAVEPAGQHHIGEEQADRGPALQQPQRVVAGRRLEHAIAQPAQDVGAVAADILVVLDHQDGLAGDARRQRPHLGGALRGRLLRRRSRGR